MNQLTQKLGSGELKVLEVPVPGCGSGLVLVRNHFSLISAGTEGATVKAARSNLLEKVRARPQQARQVLDVVWRQGVVQAYRAVMKKLDAYSPLGYSSAGEVFEVGDGVTGFAVGDRVACAGVGYANHAEIVAVPVNLCVRLPADADLQQAAYNTLGAIALQGVRQADLRVGETAVVIGLGLIGQLTGMLLRASGVRVAGIDVDARTVEAAAERKAVDLAMTRSDAAVEDRLLAFTGGRGADAVLITAGAANCDPINFAGAVARRRGRVVVVGAVPTGFDRDPHWYRKELDLRMSCSYGPGRYDARYEEQGQDYPFAYVRWTEQRNMQAFQDLVHSGKVPVAALTTHVVPLDEAPRAYDMILQRSEAFLGVLIRYDVDTPCTRGPIAVGPAQPAAAIGIGFIGAGSYAQSHLLPNLPKGDSSVARRIVMTQSGTTSRRMAERFGFESCTDKLGDLLDASTVNTIFIATRHDSHANYVVRALRAGKRVFVEKPLALNVAELEAIQAEVEKPGPQMLAVGYNRRFAPLASAMKQAVGVGPLAMLYRVNAGAIPADHWIQDRRVGGGRIIGEACHFIDFMTYLCGALPVQVSAVTLPDSRDIRDTATLQVAFADGSVGTVAYLANGGRALDKEYVEVHAHGISAVLRDFRSMEIYASGRRRQSGRGQDKGQAEMVRTFLDVVRRGGPPPIAFAELRAVSLSTFAAELSFQNRGALVALRDVGVESTT